MEERKKKIHSINALFAKIGAWQIKFRWHLLIVTTLLTIFGITGLKYVETANSRENWFDDNEAIEIATKKFEKQFGNNDNINVLVESKDVFQPEVLKAIKELGEELKEQVPYADDITSLADLEISIGTKDGIEVINPFKDGIPTDPKEIAKLKKLILSREALVNKIVSDDATETWLSLSLKEYPKKEEWEKTTNKDPMFQSGEAAIKVVTNPKWKSDKYTFKATGMAYTETEERDFFGPETKKRVFSGFLVMILFLIIFVRSLRGVFVPVFATISGIIIVFGAMGWFGIFVEYNMMTLPVMLGMALSVGYSIHIINAFKRAFNGGDKTRKEAVISAVEETGWPILFTAITTIGSVLSFISVGIVSMDWVGLTCAAVIFVDYLLIMILIPVLMSFGKERAKETKQKKVSTFSEKHLEGIGKFVIGHKKSVIIAFAVLVMGILPGVFKMSVNIDMFKFMGTKVPYIKRVYDITQSQLGSYLTYNVSIKFKEPGVVKDPKVLNNFDDFLKEVGKFELTKKSKGTASIFSILDIIKEMNKTFHGDKKKFYAIPETRELVAQLLFLYEMSGGTKTFKWIDEDYSMLRAQIQITTFNANEIVKEIKAIKRISKEKFQDAEVSVVGSAVQFAELNKKVVLGEIKSILVALTVIGFLLILVFGSIKTGLTGMIPNITPLIFIAGYMGYLDSPLDMMTMTIIPMLLGIAVDDTIHLINQIKYEFEKRANYEHAIVASLKTIGKNLTMTTIILSATFAMYIFSPVSTMTRIGVLVSLGLLVALVTDFLVTPALILITKPFGKEE